MCRDVLQSESTVRAAQVPVQSATPSPAGQQQQTAVHSGRHWQSQRPYGTGVFVCLYVCASVLIWQ